MCSGGLEAQRLRDSTREGRGGGGGGELLGDQGTHQAEGEGIDRQAGSLENGAPHKNAQVAAGSGERRQKAKEGKGTNTQST